MRLGRDELLEIGVGPAARAQSCMSIGGRHMDAAHRTASPVVTVTGTEFWNLVFIQYHQDEAGNLTP